MAGDIVNVGIIGTGMIGQVHARNLARRTAGAEVVAVMDIDEARARLVAAECGASQTYTDAFALIDDPAVDAVLISSPDISHAEQALACIRAGKPVALRKAFGDYPCRCQAHSRCRGGRRRSALAGRLHA